MDHHMFLCALLRLLVPDRTAGCCDCRTRCVFLCALLRLLVPDIDLTYRRKGEKLVSMRSSALVGT